MKLYTNGCSFTNGHQPFDELKFTQTYKDYSVETDLKKFAWPWVLGEHFDFTFNHGRYASGLDRTVRTTLQFINHLDEDEYDDWIFILQASQPHRKEYIHEEYEAYGQVAPPLAHQSLKDAWLQFRGPYSDEMDIRTYGEDPLSDLTMQFHLAWESDVSLRIHQLKNFLVLQEVLKSKGIKYLFTSMMRQDTNVKHNISRKSELMDNLMLYLDQDHVVESIELITEPYDKKTHYDECGHPNSNGHRVVAEYFKEELEKRNWLT